MKRIIFALTCCIILNGCSLIATTLTPASVIDSVARGAVVARVAEKDPPAGEELKAYLKANKELWQQLEIWFDLKESK